jgi:hypothetical protein
MTLYNFFASAIIILGFGSFMFLTRRAIANWQRPSVFVNLLTLGLCGLYLAVLYIVMGFDMQVEKMTIGVYVRPVLILFLTIPSLNVYRVKL